MTYDRLTLIGLIVLFSSLNAFGQPYFSEQTLNVPQTSSQYSYFFDQDNDGSLDLLGRPEKVSIGDINMDGFLDYFFYDDTIPIINYGNQKIEVVDNVVTLNGACSALGDYDNDGDLDLIVGGLSPEIFVTILYKNDGNGNFEEVPDTNFFGQYFGHIAWGDYDADGDLDFISSGAGQTEIYRNEGNDVFVDAAFTISGRTDAHVTWGDYNADGLLDFVLTGETTSNTDVKSIYKNDGTGFFEVPNVSFEISYDSNVEWGDLDNDGDLDLMVAGYTSIEIYRNEGSDVFTNLIGFFGHSADWGNLLDINTDGYLDFYANREPADTEGDSYYLTSSFDIATNSKPTAPTNLSASLSGNEVTFSWNPPTDDHTPSTSLAYELLVYDDFGYAVHFTGDTTNSSSRPITGEGKIRSTTYTLRNLQPGNYSYSIRAIDGAHTASDYATFDHFSIDGLRIQGTSQRLNISETGDPLNAIEVPTATAREWKYSTISGGPYESFNVPETLVEWIPEFTNAGNYYIICESLIDGNTLQSKEIKMEVTNFSQTIIPLTLEDNAITEWGDLNNDGFNDLVISQSNGLFLLIKDEGSFFSQIKLGNSISYNTRGSINLKDLNGDNFIDIVVSGGSSYDQPIFGFYLNNGDDSFSKFNSLGSYQGYSKIFDIESDGDLDIVVYPYSYNTGIDILENKGNLTFEFKQNVSVVPTPQSDLQLIDFDNDGDIDIEASSNQILINESGTFTVGGFPFPEKVKWDDYDNDGDVDALLAESFGIYSNDGSGNFTLESTSIDTFKVESSYYWWDYNLDGQSDIVAISENELFPGIRVFDAANQFELASVILPQDFNPENLFDSNGDLNLDYITNDKLLINEADLSNSPPTAPSQLNFSLINTDTVKLSWTHADDLEGGNSSVRYDVYFLNISSDQFIKSQYTLSGKTKTDIFYELITGDSLIVNDLPAGEYLWGVTAIDKSGNSSATIDGQNFTISGQSLFGNNQVLESDVPGDTIKIVESPVASTREWKFSTSPGGPYQSFESPETDTYYLPTFTTFDNYYVVCESTIDGEVYLSQELNFSIERFELQDQYSFIDSVEIYSNRAYGQWADLDNDNDLDVITSAGQSFVVYQNTGDDFIAIESEVFNKSFVDSPFDLGDINNDGLIDIIAIEDNESGSYYDSGRYKINVILNLGNLKFATEESFATITTGFYDIELGDYNNDGFLDIAGIGRIVEGSSSYKVQLFANDGYGGITLDTTISSSSRPVDFIDYDLDGDLDLMAGFQLFNNNNLIFEETSINLTLSGNEGAFDWGDYDDDGTLDFLITNQNGFSPINRLLSNNITDFINNSAVDFTNYTRSFLKFGDLNNDSGLDFIVSGLNESNDYASELYLNNGLLNFNKSNLTSFEPGQYGQIDFADYDNDGDLDVLSVSNYLGDIKTYVYKNNIETSSIPPNSPESLNETINGNEVTFSWSLPTDDITPSASLTYSIYVYDKTTGKFAVPLHADTLTGQRRLTGIGEILTTEYSVTLPAGRYSWSVQAIDDTYQGSEFSTPRSFNINGVKINGVTQILAVNEEGQSLEAVEIPAADSRQWQFTAGNPNDAYTPFSTTQMNPSLIPKFNRPGKYHIRVVSVYGSDTIISTPVKITVNAFERIENNIADLTSSNQIKHAFDYDIDGDIDVTASSYNVNKALYDFYLYRNEGNQFDTLLISELTEPPSTFETVDINKDGRFDLSVSSNNLFKIFINQESDFEEYLGWKNDFIVSHKWIDVNNDGVNELIAAGNDTLTNQFRTFILYLDGKETQLTELNVNESPKVVADFNNDGFQDFATAYYMNYSQGDGSFNSLFFNDRIANYSTQVADFNNDNYLDILDVIYNGEYVIRLFYNSPEGFQQSEIIDTTSINQRNLKIGDFNQDGSMDFYVSNLMYLNTDTGFYRGSNYIGLIADDSQVFDADLDQDPDIFSGTFYDSNIGIHSEYQLPSSPTNLRTEINNGEVTFLWDAPATDSLVSYNLYLTWEDSTNYIISPKAVLSGSSAGSLIAPEKGFIQKLDSGFNLSGFNSKSGTYLWSVQAVDASFNGSEWAQEATFDILALPSLDSIYSFSEIDSICSGSEIVLKVDHKNSIGQYELTWEYSLYNSSFSTIDSSANIDLGLDSLTIMIRDNTFENSRIRAKVAGDGGVVYSKPIQIGEILYLPPIDLGPVDSLTCNQNIELLAGDFANTNFEYIWGDGYSGYSRIVETPGQYSVSVSNDYGCIASDTINVTFETPEDLFISNDFTICINTDIELTIPDGYQNYQWYDFNDNSLYNQQTFTRDYDFIGTYRLVGIATAVNGCRISDTINISVTADQPLISLYSNYEFCGSGILDLGDQFSNILWSNGADSSSVEITESGIYSVTISNAAGCQASKSINVAVSNIPTIDVGPDIDVCVGDQVNLSIPGNYESYKWIYTNIGSVNNAQEISFEVGAATSFTYVAEVTNSDGCIARDTILITSRGETPTNSFIYEINGNEVMFTNESENGGTYEWDFGDGNTSEEENPGHTYGEAGSYTVRLTVSGCKQSVSTKTVVITNENGEVLSFSDQKIKIYPLPTTGLLKIENIKPNIHQYSVFSPVGKEVIQGKLNSSNLTLNLTELPSGIYFLELGSNQFRIVKIKK